MGISQMIVFLKKVQAVEVGRLKKLLSISRIIFIMNKIMPQILKVCQSHFTDQLIPSKIKAELP